MKKVKLICVFVLALVMLCASVLSVYGSDIMPIFDHCSSCDLSFSIHDDVAYVIVEYCAYSDTFTEMQASVKIQKKFLGIFWKTVDIGEPDNIWTASATEITDLVYGTFPITEEGAYRAVFEVNFYGTTGTVDTIEDTMEWTYNKNPQ